ncbi:DinB family protein [Fictibacillus sp. NPDC058756]
MHTITHEYHHKGQIMAMIKQIDINLQILMF